MNVVTERIIILGTSCPRAAHYGKNSYLQIFWFLLLCMFVGADAYATSQCLQWEQQTIGHGNVPGATAGWKESAQEACSATVNLCAADPLSCGYNSAAYQFRNWNGTAVGLPVVGWPGFYCYFNYQIKGVQYLNWTDQSDQSGENEQLNPTGCQVYISALFSPSAQCGPTCNGISDPINPASGAVYSAETDATSANSILAFKRFYNNTDTTNADLSDGWRHSFSRSITSIYSSSTYKPYQTRVENSSLYNDEALACTSGFAEIKSRVSTWANATATYTNGRCVISVGTTVIARLPILYTSPPTPAPNTTTLIDYDATRDDGQSISFTVNGNSIVAPPSIGLMLQQTSSGYTLTDADDSIETYDTNGKLLSITGRAGVVQTMSYDTAGRLSVVTDSFGHQISLSYDGSNRLSSVAQQ